MLIGISGKSRSGKDTAADFLVANHGFVKLAFADPIKRQLQEVFPKIPKENLWGPSERRNEPLEDYPREHGPWVDGRCACCNYPALEEPFVQCQLTVRFAAQIFGTEFGRTCYTNTWVELAFRDIDRLKNDSSLIYTQDEGVIPRWAYMPEGPTSVGFFPAQAPRGFVISDVRWPFGNEGTEIRRRGGRLLRMNRGLGLTGAMGQHPSERAMDNVGACQYDAIADNGDWTLEQLSSFVDELVLSWSKEDGS